MTVSNKKFEKGANYKIILTLNFSKFPMYVCSYKKCKLRKSCIIAADKFQTLNLTDMLTQIRSADYLSLSLKIQNKTTRA